ncbi:hypothetical protein BC628DRAFT_1418575 [Trametes gibbosa]|nr:hypothetical protein BC628DRAFT_1418575 [Trametes gibbosa]
MALVVHSPTRSVQQASLLNDAQSLSARRDVRITTLDGLRYFVAMVGCNANIGRIVEDFSISLPKDQGYPAQVVRAALRLTPNVECLVLDLPAESPVTLLNGLNFANLTAFSTNLPHRVLLSFLEAHTSLTALILRSCGRSATCPLRGLVLGRLNSLHSPSRCFSGIVPGPLVTATVNLTRLSSMSALAVQAISSSRLYSLTIDHFSNDYDVLSRVASGLPNLRKLKLNEKAHHDGHQRRPWNDLRGWHLTLLRLQKLEELNVRTLINITSANRTEQDVISAWANGVGQHAVAHPNLFYIAVIFPAGGTEPRLSHWFKRGAGNVVCLH